MRVLRPLALLVTILTPALGGCGGGDGSGDPQLGTVALLNQTDQGMAPHTVTEFYFEPVGSTALATNLLQKDLAPGGVVIIGLFPPGRYDAVAVIAAGGNISFLDIEVTAGQPTNIVIPSL